MTDQLQLLREELAGMQVDQANERNGHAADKRKLKAALSTIAAANSRGNKQHVVAYLLTDLMDQLKAD